MIPVLAIPFYNRLDLLKRCIDSIDYPVAKLVLTQNGPEAYDYRGQPPPPCVNEVVYISHPNAGVAGSWNEVIKLFPAPWWLFANNDIQFTPGDLKKMAEYTNANHRDVAHIYGNHGASWFVVTERCVRRVGLFDENFYPAYLEDCDMSYRCDLVGETRVNVPDCHAIHGENVNGVRHGSRTVNSSPQLASENSRTHGMGFKYYGEKWGGGNGREKFKRPFNNPHLTVDYWKFDTAWRSLQQWKV